MQRHANPYESPTAVHAEDVGREVERPAFVKFVICAWVIQGLIGMYFLGAGVVQASNRAEYLAYEYHTWDRLVFFLASSFFFIEIIGPWIGVYYLTGRRARAVLREKTAVRILKVAGGTAIVASLVLMLYLELIASVP